MLEKKSKSQPAGIGMAPCTTELGKLLRTRRLKLGLRQKEVAIQAGFTQTHYSTLERGTRSSLKSAQVENLAKTLILDPEEIKKCLPQKTRSTDLGTRLYAERRKRVLSQKAAADILHLKPTTLTNIELGKRQSLPPGSQGRLATFLGVSMEEFLSLVPSAQVESTTAVGALIWARREELGLTRDEVAARIGVTRQALQQMESGKIKFPKGGNPHRLEKVAQALDLDLEVLKGLQLPRRRRSPQKPHPLLAEESCPTTPQSS